MLQASRWASAPGWILIAIGILQCVTGIGAQFLKQA